MKIILAILISLMIGSFAHADCTDVIALSKVVSEVVQNRDEFESHAHAFCKAYKKSTSTQKSSSYGASYKFLSASMGKSGASTSEVASQYCSGSSGQYEKNDAYKQYVETISPYAYSAFEKCEKLSKGGIGFEVNPASTHPEEMTISVSYSSKTRTNFVTMSFASSKDVQCSWNGDIDSKSKKLIANSGAVLKCSRESRDRRSSVTVFPETSSESHLTMAWPEYNSDGHPVDKLSVLSNKLNEVLSELDSYSKKSERAMKSAKKANSRLNGISLRAVQTSTSQQFACGETRKASTTDLTFMFGSRDGTGCGVHNLNHYKKLSLEVPSQ